MAAIDEIIAALPPLTEEEKDDLLLDASAYQKERAVLRNWRLGDSLIDANIRQNADSALYRIATRLNKTEHGRLLLALLGAEAEALDTAAKTDQAIKTWLEE